MSGRSKTKGTRTRDAITDLFEHPPVTRAELEQRLKGFDTTIARRLMVDRIDSSSLDEQSGPLFLSGIGILGTGRQKSRLTRIALDIERDTRQRLWAAMALTNEDSTIMNLLVSELGPDGMEILAEHSALEAINSSREEDIGEPIAVALEKLHSEHRTAGFLSNIDSCRQGLGVSCAEAWGPALARESIGPLRPQILNYFVEEASDEGVQFLEKMREKASSERARREFQAALLRLRSLQIDPEHVALNDVGYGLVSNCDGHCGVIVLAVFDNPDQTRSVVELCLDVRGGIRDLVLHPNWHTAETTHLADDLRDQLGCSFVETDLKEVSELVFKGGNIDFEDGRALTIEVRRALSLFERVSPGFCWGVGSCCSPAEQVDEKSIRALLARAEYEDTWLFDAGDLKEEDLDIPPDDPAALNTWIDWAASTLDESVIRPRLVAMAEHMARWHFWNAELDSAALCRALAEDVRQQFSDSALVRIMLERTADAFGLFSEETRAQYGNPKIRQRLRAEFFAEILTPQAPDIARLDFAEISTSILEKIFNQFPVDAQPSETTREKTAFTIGKTFADHLTGRGTVQPEEAVGELSRVLTSTCDLTEDQRHQVLMTVVPALYAFVEEVCARCSVKCLYRPDEDMSEFFFSTSHPSSIEFSGLCKNDLE